MKQNHLLIIQELLWVIVALAVTLIVLAPVMAFIDFKDYLFNGITVFLFVTLLRSTVQYRQIPHLKYLGVRLVLFVVLVNLFIWVLSGFQGFLERMEYFDLNEFAHSFHQELSMSKQSSILNYLKTEITFFSIGSLLMIILFIVRMIISYFRKLEHIGFLRNEHVENDS